MVTLPRRFSQNYVYHVFNCGVEKRDIFNSGSDYQRFLEVMGFYLYDQIIAFTKYKELDIKVRKNYWNDITEQALPRIKILAYCLMPNHFHFLLTPNRPDGITKFISEVCNSHTRFFNTKYERIGKLYQASFKAKEIRTEPSLLQVLRYILLNPVNSKRTNPDGTLHPGEYPYVSYRSWAEESADSSGYFLLDKEEVEEWLEYIGGRSKLVGFVESKMEDGQDLSEDVENFVMEP